MAGILAWLTGMEWGISDHRLALGVLCLTWGAYSYIRLATFKEKHVEEMYSSVRYFLRFTIILILPLGVYIISEMLTVWWHTSILLAPPALLVAMYPLRSGRWSIRQMPGAKSTLIALAWVWLSLSLPALLYGLPFDSHLVSAHLQRFFFMIVWLIPFDIRDMKVDAPNMQTLPQQLGEASTKNITAWMIFGLQLSFILSAWLGHHTAALTFGYVIGLEYLHQWIKRSNFTNDILKTGFWIEATPLVVVLSFWFFKIIFSIIG
jgi:hypothetical protein